MCNQEGVNADYSQTNKEKARSPDEFGPKTHVEAVQAKHTTAMWKAVAGRQHLGMVAPTVRPHHQLRQLPPAAMCHLLVIPP